MYRDHKQGHSKVRWIFMILFTTIYYKDPDDESRTPGHNETSTTVLYKSIIRIFIFNNQTDN